METGTQRENSRPAAVTPDRVSVTSLLVRLMKETLCVSSVCVYKTTNMCRTTRAERAARKRATEARRRGPGGSNGGRPLSSWSADPWKANEYTCVRGCTVHLGLFLWVTSVNRKEGYLYLRLPNYLLEGSSIQVENEGQLFKSVHML